MCRDQIAGFREMTQCQQLATVSDPDPAAGGLQSNRGRKYRTTTEQTTARTQFKKNLQYIVAENAKGTNPFILGITNFTDLSYADFAAKFLMAPQAPPPAKKAGVIGRRLSGLRSKSGSRWGRVS